MLFSPPRLHAYQTYYGSKIVQREKKFKKREQERTEYILRQGYEIEIFWECEYENLLKTSPDFKTFNENKRIQRPLEYRSTLTTSEIITAVREEKYLVPLK